MSIVHQSQLSPQPSFETFFANERTRIVRLCTRLTGDADASEDLAQEAMIEAWRTAIRVEDPAALSAWLSGCARNVCQRWARKRGRELAHRAPISIETGDAAALFAGDDDLELELERDDLATLLDRALNLLPTDTRDAMIHHYIEQRSHAEIADLLDSSENAVTVRLHRGRLAFRKALSSPELRPLSTAFGLAVQADDRWQETRIWCQVCGNRRLIGYLSEDRSEFHLKCPDCHPYSNVYTTSSTEISAILQGISAIKPAYTRCADFMVKRFSQFMIDGYANCYRCGAQTPMRDGHPDDMPEEYRNHVAAHYLCEQCGARSDSSLCGHVLWHPEGRAFWRANPRIRLHPEQIVEANGSPAVVTIYESVATGERYEVLSRRDTFQPILINGQSVE